MARAKKPTPQVEKVQPYLEGVAKNLVDKLYGPAGPAWGTKLSDIEELLIALRAVLSEAMLREALTRQAAAQADGPTPLRRCPSCQQPLACTGHNPRLLETDAGEAAWAEPEGYCDRCRRSFFPSVPKPGH